MPVASSSRSLQGAGGSQDVDAAGEVSPGPWLWSTRLRVDIASPRPHSDGPYPYRTLRPLVQQARDAGLGVTIHVGEEGSAYGIAKIREVVSTLRPDRIGHGILAARQAADGPDQRGRDRA